MIPYFSQYSLNSYLITIASAEIVEIAISEATVFQCGKIREEYFIKNHFIYPQSNRITQLIYKRYGNEPEFLWEKFDGSGIFRNPESKKWYAGILDVEGSKINKNKKGIIEVLDIKLDPKEIQELLLEPGFYPAYHMNKKSWITIILDESLSDKKIMELIEKSHKLSFKK